MAKYCTITARGGSLTLGASRGAYTDSDGVKWITNEVGYGGGVVGDVIQKTGDHGGWLTDQYYTPRYLTLKVTIIAPTEDLRNLACGKLRRFLPINSLVTLNISDTTSFVCSVRRYGEISERHLNPTHAEFSIGVVAPDPRLYGTDLREISINFSVLTSGLTFPLTFPITFPANGSDVYTSVGTGGDIDTPFVATLFGPRTNPAIINRDTGAAISFTGLDMLTSGDILVIDAGNYQATYNGTYYPADATSAWFRLPGATTTTLALGGTGTGGGMIQWRDAYER